MHDTSPVCGGERVGYLPAQSQSLGKWQCLTGLPTQPIT